VAVTVPHQASDDQLKALSGFFFTFFLFWLLVYAHSFLFSFFLSMRKNSNGEQIIS
jgi:hypothetical protein